MEVRCGTQNACLDCPILELSAGTRAEAADVTARYLEQNVGKALMGDVSTMEAHAEHHMTVMDDLIGYARFPSPVLRIEHLYIIALAAVRNARGECAPTDNK